MQKLDSKIAKQSLSSFQDWKINSKQIKKTFKFKDFKDAIGFVDKVASEAENVNHHPDIDIRYNKVTITLTTHDAGGVSEKDIEMAKNIEGIDRKA